ncbi:MAG: glutathione S-transferase family protein [Halomonadaceae bacterium]|nr:MAG: glutathione S-transferase family protein [Halomonadaceae bacterium]
MKIYEMKMAPNPRRVRMFMAEKGILEQADFVELDLQKGENLTAEFKARNPMKKVPVLELDDGNCISETMAICRYFEETHPETPLLGRNALEKAQVEQWLRWIEFYFFLPTGMCFQHTSGYFKDRMTPVPEWGEQCRVAAQKFFHFLNQHLQGRDYIVGDQLSAADINALTTIDFNKVNKLAIEPEQTHLKAWYDRISQRPSAKV